MSGLLRIHGLGILLCFWGIPSPPAIAQVEGQSAPSHISVQHQSVEPSYAPERSPPRSTAPGTGLPSFAEPAPPLMRSGRSLQGTEQAPAATVPTMPGDPVEAPVNGLAWLAAAGAAYAVRRLRTVPRAGH